MTIEQLAAELGVSMKEMHALCTVAKVSFKRPDQELKERQADRIRGVVDGSVSMDAPKAKAPGNPLKRIIIGVSLLAVVFVGWVVYEVVDFINRPTAILISPGQCFDDPGLLGAEIKAISCDGPHDFKAYATLDLTEIWTSWPGLDELETRGQERCAILAESQNIPTFEGYFFGPLNERAWADEEARRIVCAVRD